MESLSIAVVGTGGVGKTTWCHQLSGKKFNPCYHLTNQATHYHLILKHQPDPLSLTLADLPGQEQFKDLRQGIYPQVDGIILMCSDSKLSRLYLLSILKEIKAVTDKPVGLVINKADVDKTTRHIPEVVLNSCHHLGYMSCRREDRIWEILTDFVEIIR